MYVLHHTYILNIKLKKRQHVDTLHCRITLKRLLGYNILISNTKTSLEKTMIVLSHDRSQGLSKVPIVYIHWHLSFSQCKLEYRYEDARSILITWPADDRRKLTSTFRFITAV